SRVGEHVDRAVTPIVERFRVVTGAGEGPGVLLGRALRAVNQLHAVTKGFLERPIALWPLQGQRRLRHAGPGAATALEPQHAITSRPEERAQLLAVELHFDGLTGLQMRDVEGKPGNV